MSATDIGIDLGTANVIITLGDKGIVVNEPSVVAYDKKKHCVLAVGNEAYKMIGRTPEYIVAVKPLKDGVISDNEMTEAMIIEFIRKVIGRIVKPRIILCVPSSVTDVENRAVVEAALSAGARKVFIIEEPIAALLGAGIDISKPNGTMVVDVGGGTADIAVVSFNGIVKSCFARKYYRQGNTRHLCNNPYSAFCMFRPVSFCPWSQASYRCIYRHTFYCFLYCLLDRQNSILR